MTTPCSEIKKSNAGFNQSEIKCSPEASSQHVFNQINTNRMIANNKIPNAVKGVIANNLSQSATLSATATFPSSSNIQLPKVDVAKFEKLIKATSRGGLVALAAMGMNTLQEVADRQLVQHSANELNLDLKTIEGILAASAHARGKVIATQFNWNAGFSGPKNEIAAQAIALHELTSLGALSRAESGNRKDRLAIQSSVDTALQAYDKGLLQLRPHQLATGWSTVFPELTSDERGLGDIPGFLPVKRKPTALSYPADKPVMPIHTGNSTVDVPSISATTTPISNDIPTAGIMESRPYNGEGVRELGSYDTFFEHNMPVSQYMDTDAKQFQRANEALYNKIQSDPKFAKEFTTKYPKALDSIRPGSRGGFPARPPSGLTWHHNDTLGQLDLVDHVDHKKFHKIYHPDGSGGRNKWGGGNRNR